MASAVVTGCNRGIGEGIARVLLDARYHVIGWNRTPGSAGTRYTEAICDVRNPDDLARAAVQLPDDTSVVVANAGIRRFGEVERLGVADWKDSVETHLSGVFHLARATLPLLKKNRGYLIVVGSQGYGAIRRFFLGSVSLTLAMNASCSVLIVRPKSDSMPTAA